MQRVGLLLVILALTLTLMGCGGGGGAKSTLSDGGGNQPLIYDKVPTTPRSVFGDKTAIYEIVAAACVDEAGKNDPIGYQWISANHPEWLLLDSSGQQIHFADYPNLAAVDPGVPEYQQKWVDNAIEAAKSNGRDAVFMDSCNDRYDWIYSVIPTRYPTQDSYGQAMDGFVRYAAPRFHAAGLMLIGNCSGQTWESGRLAGWIQVLDGLTTEPTPCGYDQCPQEVDARWLKLYASFRSYPNKYYAQYLPNPSRIGEQNFRYAVASFLIWKGPHSYIGLYDETHPLLDARIGQPTADPSNIGTIYTRDYQNAVVYVNMSRTQSGTVTLQRGLKDYQGNAMPTGVRTLGPHDSLVLLKS